MTAPTKHPSSEAEAARTEREALALRMGFPQSDAREIAEAEAQRVERERHRLFVGSGS